MTFTASGSDSGTGLEDVSGAWSFDGGATWQMERSFTVAGLQPGQTVSVSVVARDRAGNLSAATAASASATPDTTAPRASAAVTRGYDHWSITITAADDVSGLHAAAYSFDGGFSWQAAPSFARSGLSPRTTQLIDVRVRDHMGNQATLLVDASTLDDGVPRVLPLSRQERSLDGVMSLPPGTRSYAVENEHGAIVSVTAHFRGRAVPLRNGTLDVRRLPQGSGVLTIRAIDSDGDVGEYSRTVRIDRTAPQLRAASRWVLGPRVKLQANDSLSGVRVGRARADGSAPRRATLTAAVPRKLGAARIRVRVTDVDGNSARRTVRVHRRLALGNQRLNRGIRPVTFRGDHLNPSAALVHSSFRFLGYVPPWYPSHDMQTPFVAEAQWRLVRMGCLARGAYEAGSLDLPTIRAVQAYQARTRLPVLGTIGPRTRAQLDRDLLAGLPKRCARPARAA